MEASKTTAVKSFQEEFRCLTRHIEFFKDCYLKSKDLISELENAFKNDINPNRNGSEFITKDETSKLEEFITKKASVLVIGQTNSGKSSLINELLGSSYLPTSEVPCTSRIVRIRYSETNYLKVKDWTGKISNEVTGFRKTIPKADIALVDDSKRDDKQWARCIVEVGLNNPLLQGGHLEFVDAPGMSENEVLDSIVNECVHGILQVLIYVIDGNSSLRTQDRELIYNLKDKIGNTPIFFVCNKVDFDERAAEFDRDDQEDDSYLKLENQLKIIKEKKMRIFSALVRSHIIENDLDEVDRCDVFHCVSTREVKKARRKGNFNVLEMHTTAFERMKRCFLSFASESIVRHVRKVASLLGGIQQRIFDFYINRYMTKLDLQGMQRVLAGLRHSEAQCFVNMKRYVFDNGEKIQAILTKAIKDKEDKILTEAQDMEFAPIPITEVVHRNEIVNQFKGQIQKMVLIAALNTSLAAATKTVRTVSSNVRTQLEKALEEASKSDGLLGKLVKQQLKHNDFLSNGYCVKHFLDMAFVRDYSLMTLTYKTFEPPKSFIADMVSIVKGTAVDREWKRKVAKNILDNVDRSKLKDRIIQVIYDNLHDSHESFSANFRCIEDLCEIADSQTKSQEEAVSEYGPAFAKVLCLNDALLESLETSDVRFLGQIGRNGKRSAVYACQISSGRFSEMELAGKQFHEDVSKLVYSAIQHALKRFEDGRHPNVMSPLSLVLVDNQMTLLMPRLHIDLYTALEEHSLESISVKSRLIILEQMASACIYCRQQGLQLIDPRVTNVMWNGHDQAFLNISKPRDDSICYPDDLAPFHVCTNPPPLIYTSQKVLQIASQHDVYALGIMGWLLAQGKYTRPTYAQTSDVTEIYSAYTRRANPDLTLLPHGDGMDDFSKLIVESLTEDSSLWMFDESLKKIIENMHDNIITYV